MARDDDHQTDADQTSGEDDTKQDESDDAGPTPEEARKTRRKRIITIAIVVVVAIAAAIGGVYWYLRAQKFESTDDAFVDGNIVRIAAQESGQLVELPVVANTVVQAGDILARIEPATLTAQLNLRQAQLAQARTSVGEAEAGIVEARAAASGSEAQANGAQVTARNARARADRFSALAAQSGQQAISTQSLDDELSAAAQAEATAAAAQADALTAQSRVTAAQAQLEAAKAGVAAAEASVAAAQVDVDQLTITAPIAGQVVQRNVNLGSYVSPGMQIMAIVPEDLFVTANFKETQLGRIRSGQEVDLAVDAFPDVEFTGTVQSIQNGAGQAFQLLPAQNATGNFVKVVQRVPVRISIDGPDLSRYPIGPGMSVVPRIHVEK